MEDRKRRCHQSRVTLANPEDTIRGRAGLSILLYAVFHLFEKKMFFPQQLYYFQYNGL